MMMMMSRRSSLGATAASWRMLLLLHIAVLLAAPIATLVSATGDHAEHKKEESALEHMMEVYDKDGGHTLSSTELEKLFDTLQDRVSGVAKTGAAAATDSHAGHGHAAPAATTTTKVTRTLKLAHMIEHYADNNPQGLNESAFLKACPEMLKCASESTCEFQHDDTHAAAKKEANPGRQQVALKVVMLVVIFFEALVGGLLPLFVLKTLTKADAVLSLMNAFSGGVFLTAGLTHILPHVVEQGADVDGYGHYPLPYALVTLGYLVIFLVERVLFHSHGHTLETDDDEGRSDSRSHSHGHGHGHGEGKGEDNNGHAHGSSPHNANGFVDSLVVLVAISLHAILAGVSLGIQSKRNQVLTIAVAITSHKAPAAFSIGSKLIRNGMSAMQTLSLVGIFSLVTPVGIAIGIGVGNSSPMAALILEGLAAGTFIYVGATEISSDEFETTAKACDQAHRTGHDKTVDQESLNTHSHRVHAPPSRVARLAAFSAYAAGCLVILLSNLAPHADH